ncbi:MAG TPA: hypothetical protein PKM57_02180 [Kiritimatiellia bacterium]|nr:hypothetical protein [Kiritimatiellia bacterium]HPS09667.1 hypothetical protein [Kiritimatiellia bacterium]
MNGKIILVALVSVAVLAGAVDDDAAFRATVEADWAAQEKRAGRLAQSPEAIQLACQRVARLLDGLSRAPRPLELTRERADLAKLQTAAAKSATLPEAERLSLYRGIRWIGREAALKNPLLGARPVVFMQRRRFVTQMLHEYLGYYYDYGDIAGGGVYVLETPGRSLRTRDLIAGRLPRGNFTTLSLGWDGHTIYFAYAERAPEKPDFRSPQRRCFHLYTVQTDGSGLRQLTDGPNDDFDPCPLPDGGVAFMSTRRGGFGRCHNPWEPLPTYTLHRMNGDGSGVQTLSWHETNEWHPSVLADGRIAYSRWDYVDRSAAQFHGIWTSNPDGTSPSILFGNYTMRINACYQPRAIPGSNRIVFVAGAHHAAVGGSLVVVDPSRTSLDPKSGEDNFDSLEVLTPEVCFPEAAGWPDSYFHSPCPLSEDYYLVSFSFDPLPGMGPKVVRDGETGLYYFDRFGNMELLYRAPGISSMYPTPLGPRPKPPAPTRSCDPALGDEGELVLSDVRASLTPLPSDRPVRSLRIFQLLPKSETHVANQPRIGYANAECARMLLGTVPVESDGSAFFRAPARRPLFFQAVDASGRAVHTMRSAVYLQPGERRSCVGCHERPESPPPDRQPLASRHALSKILAGPDGTRPWCFPRLVQPVLDRHCVRCHDGAKGPQRGTLILTGTPEGEFSKAYNSLKGQVRWYEWGDKSIAQAVTLPGHMGADESPLLKVLDGNSHRGRIRLSDDDRLRLCVWLDGNAAFYGTYGRQEQAAQCAGQAVPPPRVQ